MKKAQQLHYQLLPLIPMLFSEGSPSGIKCVLKQLGICEEAVRLLLVNITKSLSAKITSFCEEYYHEAGFNFLCPLVFCKTLFSPSGVVLRFCKLRY